MIQNESPMRPLPTGTLRVFPGEMAPGFQDRQPERVDADREQQPHQRVDGVALHRPDEQHLGAATADGEQKQA